MDKLNFGTAGIPLSTKNPTTTNGIKRVKELGLDNMEMEFVHGVRMKFVQADEVKIVGDNLGVVLTAHAPFYINLNSAEREKVEASVRRILATARVTKRAGGYSITFHASFYMMFSKEKTYDNTLRQMKKITKILKDEDNDIWIRPELTGKGSQFGDLDEIIRLSEDIEGVLPCIDFAHYYARSVGKFNTYEHFSNLLEKIEDKLGRLALDNMHIHISGIEFGEKGERKHLPIKESEINYKDILKAWKDFKIKGVVISESPDIEEDALLLKNYYLE